MIRFISGLFFKEVYSKTVLKSINKSLILLDSQEEITLNIHYHLVCSYSIFEIYSMRVLAAVIDGGIAWSQIVNRPWVTRKYHFKKAGFYDKNLRKTLF
jgi:hypothetical protein